MRCATGRSPVAMVWNTGCFLTVPEVVDPQVAGNRHGRLSGVGVPSPTSGDRVAIDLFFGVVEQHIAISEGLLNTGKAVGKGDGRPLGSGLNHQDVHIVDVIAEFSGDWLLGRGPQKSLEHIFGTGTAGDESMMALGRRCGNAMSAQNARTTVRRHNHVKGGVWAARLVGP